MKKSCIQETLNLSTNADREKEERKNRQNWKERGLGSTKLRGGEHFFSLKKKRKSFHKKCPQKVLQKMFIKTVYKKYEKVSSKSVHKKYREKMSHVINANSHSHGPSPC